jgi:hypothetical protein
VSSVVRFCRLSIQRNRLHVSSIESKLSDVQLQVLDLLRLAGHEGMTCDQIEQAGNLRHQTASARLYELRGLKLIETRGLRRKTTAGRTAAVWVLTEVAEAHLRAVSTNPRDK